MGRTWQTLIIYASKTLGWGQQKSRSGDFGQPLWPSSTFIHHEPSRYMQSPTSRKRPIHKDSSYNDKAFSLTPRSYLTMNFVSMAILFVQCRLAEHSESANKCKFERWRNEEYPYESYNDMMVFTSLLNHHQLQPPQYPKWSFCMECTAVGCSSPRVPPYVSKFSLLALLPHNGETLAVKFSLPMRRWLMVFREESLLFP